MRPAAVAPGAGSRRTLVLWLLAGLAAYLALTWLFGGAETLAACREIGSAWVVGGLALTTLSFAVRAIRWHLILRAMGAHLQVRVNAAIYLAGIGLSATPGKLGETVRSAFLVQRGVAVRTSLAAFLADRLSDLHAVVLMVLFPLAWSQGWHEPAVQRWALLFMAISGAPILLGLLLRWRRWPSMLDRLSRVRWAGRMSEWLHGGAIEFTRLWMPRLASLSVLASLVAYGLQGIIFSGMVAQVGPQVSITTSFWIFAASTLAGAASFIPGGVGAMELALVLLLRGHGIPAGSALAVALCLRGVTFWFGMVLGALGLTVAARHQRTLAGAASQDFRARNSGKA